MISGRKLDSIKCGFWKQLNIVGSFGKLFSGIFLIILEKNRKKMRKFMKNGVLKKSILIIKVYTNLPNLRRHDYRNLKLSTHTISKKYDV